MSNIQTGAERMPHDLSHLGFLAGQIGRLITISTTPVIAGDSFEMDAVGALRLTDQERDYFMQRYHDVISSFGGKTSYDADNRPLLVMRSNLWASGYDVDGTDQTSLGQFS